MQMLSGRLPLAVHRTTCSVHPTLLPMAPRHRAASPRALPDEGLNAKAEHIAGGHEPKGPVSMDRRSMLLGTATCGCAGCSARPAAAAGGWYDNVFAWFLQHGMSGYEASIRPIKSRMFELLFATLPGAGGTMSSASSTAGPSTSIGSSDNGPVRLLEIGCGTMPNLAYYDNWGPASLQVTGLDPVQSMWPYARENAATAGFAVLDDDSDSASSSTSADKAPGRTVRLVQGTAEELPFPDDSFDAVVITLVLCSVSDPSQVLAEAARTLRPGGCLLFVEHVVSPEPGLTKLAQRALDPLQQIVAAGCHLTRDTLATLQASSKFKIDQISGFDFEAASEEGLSSSSASGRVGEVLRLSVPGLGILAPHVAGVIAVGKA